MLKNHPKDITVLPENFPEGYNIDNFMKKTVIVMLGLGGGKRTRCPDSPSVFQELEKLQHLSGVKVSQVLFFCSYYNTRILTKILKIV